MLKASRWVAARPLVLACLLPATGAGFGSEVTELARGVSQVRDGDFESAVLTLDEVVRQLSTTSPPGGEIAKAYLYLGAAYAGLGEEALARDKFRLAIRQDPDLRPAADEFPAKVLRLFESARTAEQKAASLGREASKSRGKGGLILLGLGGAAAAGVAATVATRERSNTPPSATFAFEPPGQALTYVTLVTFRASATDPDGDALTYSWDLGGGNRADGQSVQHTYTRSLENRVSLTVHDGLAAFSVSGTLTSATLEGPWRVEGDTFLGVRELRLTPTSQAGGVGEIVVVFPGGQQSPFAGGQLTHPRRVVLFWQEPSDDGRACFFIFQGEADPELRTIPGSLSCTDCFQCSGQRRSTRLVRQ